MCITAMTHSSQIEQPMQSLRRILPRTRNSLPAGKAPTLIEKLGQQKCGDVPASWVAVQELKLSYHNGYI